LYRIVCLGNVGHKQAVTYQYVRTLCWERRPLVWFDDWLDSNTGTFTWLRSSSTNRVLMSR
jgi:hypothetical protein